MTGKHRRKEDDDDLQGVKQSDADLNLASDKKSKAGDDTVKELRKWLEDIDGE